MICRSGREVGNEAEKPCVSAFEQRHQSFILAMEPAEVAHLDQEYWLSVLSERLSPCFTWYQQMFPISRRPYSITDGR